MTTDPAELGARILAGLERGRRVALEMQKRRAEELAELVLRAERLDRAAGRPDRGRAGRIVRRLHREGVEVSERHARRILDRLSGMSDSLASTPGKSPTRSATA